MAIHRGLRVLLLLSFVCGSTALAEKGAAKAKAAATAVAVESLDRASEEGERAGRRNADQARIDQPVALDARIQKGKLANGLTYYILPHKKPENRAQFWLAVNAGSVLEDEDQRGLAHFVEHMGFNGTRRFPKQDLVKFIESIGVKFGPDLNAYTSFDQTVYMLQVPTDKPEPVEKAFSILRDWAGDISFDKDEVEKERGVVLEEWRLGRGASRRIFDKQAPVLFHGSKYAERIPIGDPKIIETASRETLLRFYRDWYRPDLMAVIAVGDFVPADVEKLIRSQFSDLKGPEKPRARALVEMPAHEKTLVSIETDPEMPRTSVSVITKMPHRPERTEADYRRGIVELLHRNMLNSRLDEVRRRADAPFLAAGSGTSDYVRSTDTFSQSASVKEDGVEAGLAALLEETARIEKHGFLASELERAKKAMLRTYERGVEEREKTDARVFAREMTRNYFEGEMMGGPESELALVRKFLPTVTLAELNKLAGTLGGDGGNRVILVTGPDTMKKPSAASLLALAGSMQGREIAAWEDSASSEPLLAKVPAAGKVTGTQTIPEIGVTVWTLSNGARVVHKETDFKNDEVILSAFSPGGHSLVKDADYENARFADRVIAEGGIANFDATQLRKLLAGKIAWVSADIGELEESLSGRASPDDLETMFQLIRLRFTAPRKDPSAFESWRARASESAKNRRLNPEVVFYEDYYTFLSKNHRRRMPATPEMFAALDLDKALSIYRDRFADAGDFTFVFVGNVAKDRVKALSETYLASLPTKGRKEAWRDVKVKWPKGVNVKTVEVGSEPKSRVVLTFHGKAKWSEDAENDMQMLSEVLRFRLREVLREDMGGVYGVGAGGGIQRRPKQEYRFTVSFGCAPESVDELKAAVFAEIKAIQEKGIGADYIQKIKEARVRAHEVALKENNFWVGQLRSAFTYGDDPKEIPNITPMLEKVSSDRVRAAAKKYLKSSQYAVGILKPEPAATTTAGGDAASP